MSGVEVRAAAQVAFDTADWRRRVFALYATVRRVSADSPFDAHELWRHGRDQLFRSHPASPIDPDDDFAGLAVAPYDPAWRFELAVEQIDEPARIEVETGTDGVVPFERVGRVSVPDVGTLEVWRLASYGGGVFVPVADGSADTYGGGRYLLDTIKGADLGGSASSLVLDFNFAYNPSCAYDPRWACPLAPPGNRLRVEVPVGERHTAG